MFLRKFIKSINPYANSMQKKALGDICSEEDFRRILELERERVERNRHIFSLLVLDTKVINGNNDAIGNTTKKIICRMRKIDQIGWYDSERIGILLPYPPFQGACELAESICNSLGVPMLESACKVYVYPTE
ncbi:MAG: hypothetical protein JRC88_11795 [Deltaproteobacteria bacterium]|nr:hypothetical protein [Deltaproteobacteria bacterium]